MFCLVLEHLSITLTQQDRRESFSINHFINSCQFFCCKYLLTTRVITLSLQTEKRQKQYFLSFRGKILFAWGFAIVI